MEDYQRKKMYRIHLKNISQIKNCRAPANYTAYPSRLYNFSLKTTFRKKYLKSLGHSNSHSKIICNEKKKQQRRTSFFFQEKENIRLTGRITNAYGSINMRKYESEYQEHKKIMNLHRKVKQSRRVILYKIYDITFKNLTPNLKQIFTIYDLSKGQNSEEVLIQGNIFQLRDTMIRGFKGQKLILKVVGRAQGVASILDGIKMVPILQNKEVIGTMILEVY